MTRGAAEPTEPVTTRVSTIVVQLESIVAQQLQMGLDLRACAKNVEDLRIDVLKSRQVDPWKLITSTVGILGAIFTGSALIGGLIAACVWYRIQIVAETTGARIDAVEQRISIQEASSSSAARRTSTPAKSTTKGPIP